MARTKKRISTKKSVPVLPAFKRPVLAGSRSPSKIASILDGRLDRLCEHFGIKSADPVVKYRELCILLLAEVLGEKGFQVVQKIPRGRGGNTRWTVQLRFELLQFIDAQLKRKVTKGNAKRKVTKGEAFGLAREKFAPELKDGSIKDVYSKTKRLFAAAPRTATLMKLMSSAPHTARHIQLFLASPTKLKTPKRR